ncbi:MAG: restriction endonuclease [Planctomycetes bacterium]|nr:restriction endonuclease [Planctomycetota bacterium]
MALWLIRAGSQGEYEFKFLNEERVYLTWGELVDDLTKAKSREDVADVMRRCLPEAGENKLRNHIGQVWAFCSSIAPGDWFALPSKFSSTIHFGEITGPLRFDSKAEAPFKHYRTCKWIERDVPRSRFDQDLLYSLGAYLTICRITRNDAEARIRAIAANGWQSNRLGIAGIKPPRGKEGREAAELDTLPTEDVGTVDLEELGRDSIARMNNARFKGHGLARLVESILRAEGYSTHRSPEGPDHGVDILAGTGPMGFGSPRICVQVKSGETSTDRPSVDQLVGTMQHVGADHGLFVAWGGFKDTVQRERAQKYFRLRLWDQKELIDQLLAHYADLDPEVRADLPLKRVWTVAGTDEDA